MVDLFDMSHFKNDFREEAEHIFDDINKHVLGIMETGRFKEGIDRIIRGIDNLSSAAAFLGLDQTRKMCLNCIKTLKQLKDDKNKDGNEIEKTIYDVVGVLKNSVFEIFGDVEKKKEEIIIPKKFESAAPKTADKCTKTIEEPGLKSILEKLILLKNGLEDNDKINLQLTKIISEMKEFVANDTIKEIFLFRSGEKVYAFETENVLEIIRSEVDDYGKISFNNEKLDTINLDAAINGNNETNLGKNSIFFIVGDGKIKKGIGIDEIIGKYVAVIRQFPNYLVNIPGIKSAAVLKEGDIIMVIDTKIINEF